MSVECNLYCEKRYLKEKQEKKEMDNLIRIGKGPRIMTTLFKEYSNLVKCRHIQHYQPVIEQNRLYDLKQRFIKHKKMNFEHKKKNLFTSNYLYSVSTLLSRRRSNYSNKRYNIMKTYKPPYSEEFTNKIKNLNEEKSISNSNKEKTTIFKDDFYITEDNESDMFYSSISQKTFNSIEDDFQIKDPHLIDKKQQILPKISLIRNNLEEKYNFYNSTRTKNNKIIRMFDSEINNIDINDRCIYPFKKEFFRTFRFKKNIKCVFSS